MPAKFACLLASLSTRAIQVSHCSPRHGRDCGYVAGFALSIVLWYVQARSIYMLLFLSLSLCLCILHVCIYIYYICYPPPPGGLGHSLRTSLSDPSIPNSRFLAGHDEGKGMKRGLAVNGQEFLVIDGEG